MVNKIAEKRVSTNFVLERSSSSTTQALGKHDSTMCLYEFDEPGRLMVEWDIPGLDETMEIGIWINSTRGELTDYDGVFSLAQEVIEFLEENNITVGSDFR